MSVIGQCISYPKSGRTWLRYMLNLVGHDSSVAFHHDTFEFNDGTLPIHDFDIGKRLERYRPDDLIVYLDRDPRDVIVSLYHQVTGRFRDFFDYRGDISAFVRDDYFGAGVLAKFRSAWKTILSERPYLHISYEQLHQDPHATLKAVLSYFDLACDEQCIAEAVSRGQRESMRQVELSGTFSEPWLRPRNGAPKVRRGEIGAFRDELSDADIAYVNAVFGMRD